MPIAGADGAPALTIFTDAVARFVVGLRLLGWGLRCFLGAILCHKNRIKVAVHQPSLNVEHQVIVWLAINELHERVPVVQVAH